jgi:DNA-binding CsgD family transcriptional regulator
MTTATAWFTFRTPRLAGAEEKAFRDFLHNSLCDRLPVLMYTLGFLQGWLLGVDALRYAQGTLLTVESQRYLLGAHLSLLVFWPLLLVLRRHEAAIRGGTYPAVRYWLVGAFLLFHVQALTHAVLAYHDRGSLVVYLLMLGYYQLVFLWYQSIRTLSALLALVVMGTGILLMPRPVSEVSDWSDFLLSTILIYALSTTFFNARLKFFKDRYRLAVSVQHSETVVDTLKTRHEQVVNELEQRNRELTAYALQELAQNGQDAARTEAKWRQFKLLFEAVHPDFWSHLAQQYPTLSTHESRLVVLLRMNLSTKEIADVLGISPQSANTARYRLRKKLSLQPDQELEAFVRNL